ncbi:3D domain-containing protein [Limnochorda pilosa]|uniref:G5 domain-containing protein n=1 Tax=Limnochorda pilosa TaxID=1555112 RepID=A0A0K2SQM1_LIMPI|nr:3D domain-containing protein [Limnochorda pilosa]BAS29425.1 hypothetical protein LIP_3617 [Limnochorda pilosa]
MTAARSRKADGSPLGSAGWRGILKGVVLVAVLGGLAAAAPGWAVKEVTVSVDGTRLTQATLKPTVAGVLAEVSVELGDDDRVYPGLTAPVTRGLLIEVRKAFPVALRVGGREVRLQTAASTVGELLREAGVELGALDEVTPALDTRLPGPATVQVVRVRLEERWEEQTVPHDVLRWAEPTLAAGSTRVIRQGRDGLDRVHVELRFEDGNLVERRELARERVQEPVAKIVGIGQRQGGAQVVRTPQGPKRFSRVLEVLATAYTPGPESTAPYTDGLTATGVVARRGVVAVDPTVIPLGSHLYIPGYGLGVAADVGAAIKGRRIDLLYEDLGEALRFGRQYVKVYVLDE